MFLGTGTFYLVFSITTTNPTIMNPAITFGFRVFLWCMGVIR